MDKTRNRGALFFISVLLHSLFVLLPWQEKSRPLALSSSPASPISVVDASLLELSASEETQPTPAVPASPSTPAVPLSPPVAVSVDPPVDSTTDPPEATDSLANEPEFELVPGSDADPAATPFGESSTSSTDTPGATPADEATITAEWDSFVGQLQLENDGLQESSILFVFDTFAEPERTNQLFDENDESKLDNPTYYHFTKKEAEEVFDTVVLPEVNNNTGFDLQPLENFTVGLVYQLSQGDMLRYLIIVPLEGRSGSVLIVSDSLPG